MKQQVQRQLRDNGSLADAPAPSPRHQTPRLHDLERQRVERIAREIAAALEAAGALMVDVGSLESVDDR
jgi:hypothetical protein